MTDHTAIFIAITCCFLLAGVVKGVIGMGLPTVAMGLLGLAMPPVQAAALLVLPSLVTNVWQMLAGPGLRRLVRRLFTMQFCVCLGTFAGIGFLTGSSTSIASALLGAVLVAYAAAGLLAVRFTVRPAAEPWLSPVVGMLTGLLTGATGVFVVPAVPYLGSLALEKEELIQALGLSFTVSTVALGASLAFVEPSLPCWLAVHADPNAAGNMGLTLGRVDPQRRFAVVGVSCPTVGVTSAPPAPAASGSS